MRYFSEKILRLRFALVEEQLPPAIVLLESAALSTTLRMTHYFSWVFNLQISIYRVVGCRESIMSVDLRMSW